MKTPEQMRREVIDDLTNTAHNHTAFLRSLVADYVDRHSDEQIRKMWLDAGLDERGSDDDQD